MSAPRRGRALLALAALAGLASAGAGALAGEIAIGGRSRDGTFFSFDFAGAEPDPGAERFTPPGAHVPELWSASPLRVVMSRGTGRSHLEEFFEGQCVLFINQRSSPPNYISCATTPRNALSGVVFEQRGAGSGGNARYVCTRGCSRRAPARIEFSDVESGC